MIVFIATVNWLIRLKKIFFKCTSDLYEYSIYTKNSVSKHLTHGLTFFSNKDYS